jgi:hypothetical protein
MKELKQVVNESNLEIKEAFKVMKSNASISAKEFIGNVFKVKGYVIVDTELTTLETGEVEKGKSICFLTETDEIIGSNSSSLLKTFLEIKETFGDIYDTLDVKITKGTSKNGQTFLSLELA